MPNARTPRKDFATVKQHPAVSDKASQSDRISSQIHAFENSGGRIEKLGVTPYLHKRPQPKYLKPAPGNTSGKADAAK